MNRRAIALLAARHFLTDLCRGDGPALLPFLVIERHFSYTAVASLVFAISASSSVVQPLFGQVADRLALSWLLPASVSYRLVLRLGHRPRPSHWCSCHLPSAALALRVPSRGRPPGVPCQWRRRAHRHELVHRWRCGRVCLGPDADDRSRPGLGHQGGSGLAAADRTCLGASGTSYQWVSQIAGESKASTSSEHPAR